MPNFTIIAFNKDNNDFGLYVSGYRNEFGTALYFRGTLEDCLYIRRIDFGPLR